MECIYCGDEMYRLCCCFFADGRFATREDPLGLLSKRRALFGIMITFSLE